MPEIRKRPLAVAPNGERLAINLFDATDRTRISEDTLGLLLGGKLDRDRGSVIRVDPGRPDETAVPFSCDLLTAACVADTIREHDRLAKDYPCRVYLNRGGRSWERIPCDTRLTLVVGEKVVLNPKVFRVAVAGTVRRQPETVEW